jgi:hypothetical protein
MVWRAITKYNAAYGDMSPQMQSFRNWMGDWLQKELKSEHAAGR